MSKQHHENVSTSSASLKRKRAPVWPLATRAQCEEVFISLTAEGILQEFSPPPTSGASTQERQRAKFSMNVSSAPSTIKDYGQARRTVNTPKTLKDPQAQLDLREDTSPPSIPVSPNYFDLLSVEEEEAHPPSQPQEQQQQEHQQEHPQCLSLKRPIYVLNFRYCNIYF
jgi:hypothetical protein